MSHVSAMTAWRLYISEFPQDLFTGELCFWYTNSGVTLVSYPHNPECKTTHQSVCKKLNNGLSYYWSGDTAAMLRNYTFAPTAEQIMCAFGADAQFVMFWYDISVDAFRCDIAIGTWSAVAPPNKNGADAAAEIWLAWKKWKENKTHEDEQF